MTKRELEMAARTMARALLRLEAMARKEDDSSAMDAVWSSEIRPIVKRALAGHRELAGTKINSSGLR